MRDTRDTEIYRYIIWSIGIIFFALGDLFWFIAELQDYRAYPFGYVAVIMFVLTIVSMIFALAFEISNLYIRHKEKIGSIK